MTDEQHLRRALQRLVAVCEPVMYRVYGLHSSAEEYWPVDREHLDALGFIDAFDEAQRVLAAERKRHPESRLEFARRFVASRLWLPLAGSPRPKRRRGWRQPAKTLWDNSQHVARGWREDEFDRFVRLMREHGGKGGVPYELYTYLDLDGFTYWTFDWPEEGPVEETELIHRTPSDQVENTYGPRRTLA